MTALTKLPVAFTFVNDGKEWHGGLNYFRSLFLALQSLPQGSVEPVAFVGAEANIARYKFPGNVRVVQDCVLDRLSPKWTLNKLATKLLGAPWLTNSLIRRHGIGIVSHASPSRDPALKTVGWIPDFQHMHLPHFFPEKELKGRTSLYLELIERSALVIVSSESARKDLQRFAPQFAHKARVLRFCAVQPNLDADAPIDVGSTYGLHAPYFYLPNQAWAHKNHLAAIRALAELTDDFPDVKIVCSGSLGDYRNPGHLEALQSEIAQHGLTERFLMLGVVPYPHIAQLMLQSVAVINPSLFEGWSTTVEEAKALGVPLILSGIDVHREQCERGEATFFDPTDAAALADRMRSMLSASRDDLRALAPQEVRERHRLRVTGFARTYERIIAEVNETAPSL